MAILRYADKLTRHPSTITEADVDELRSAGCSNRDILDVCEVIAYYAYVNRIADGLGVKIEEWLPND